MILWVHHFANALIVLKKKFRLNSIASYARFSNSLPTTGTTIWGVAVWRDAGHGHSRHHRQK